MAVAPPVVLTFLVLTLLFAALLLSLELQRACIDGVQTVECGAVFEGFAGADRVGWEWIPWFRTSGTATETRAKPKRGDVVVIRPVPTAPPMPAPTPEPAPDPNPVPKPGPVFPPGPTPADDDDRCGELNRSIVPPRLLPGNAAVHGIAHILQYHSWDSNVEGRARFYEWYSTAEQITAIYGFAMQHRASPWTYHGSSKTCRVRVDVGASFGAVGLDDRGRATSTVEVRADYRTVAPYVQTMFPD